ncbi:MAG: hypothetical protein KDH20_12925 [Rhodocyclaceae bacterium]|nr:hypothetical protein [Rhodocyclaceae bacterium]
MKLKTTFAAIALSLLPLHAIAMCSGHEQQAQSCAEGTVWDDAAKACVNQVTG